MEQNEKVKTFVIRDVKENAPRFHYDGFRPTVSHASISMGISRSMILIKNMKRSLYRPRK